MSKSIVPELRSFAGYLRELQSITDVSVNGRDTPIPLALAELIDGAATELEKLEVDRDALDTVLARVSDVVMMGASHDARCVRDLLLELQKTRGAR